MPTYEYRCEACSRELELYQNISEAPKKKCPSCGRLKLRRKIGGGAGFLFKGSGFYQTDYRSESYKKAADADQKPASDSGSGKKSEGKSEASSGSEKPGAKPHRERPKEKRGKSADSR